MAQLIDGLAADTNWYPTDSVDSLKGMERIWAVSANHMDPQSFVGSLRQIAEHKRDAVLAMFRVSNPQLSGTIRLSVLTTGVGTTVILARITFTKPS